MNSKGCPLRFKAPGISGGFNPILLRERVSRFADFNHKAVAAYARSDGGYDRLAELAD